MNQIDPELLKRLDALAAKLGVTAQYLWGVLTRQAYIEGIMSSAIGFLLLAVSITFAIICKLSLKRRIRTNEARWEGDTPRVERYSWAEETDGWAFGVPFLLSLLALIFGVSEVTDGITAALNPAYFAFKHIGDIVR